MILICLILLTGGCKTKIEKKKLAEPSFCEADTDCGLYNCTNCGNSLWIEENEESNEGCNNKRKIDCKCENSVCKRVYK